MPKQTNIYSIIIPVYNDAKGLRDTIESLLQQSFKKDLEIVIVDNNSNDDTQEVAELYADNYKHITVIVEDRIQSSYAARNAGIEYATGDILIFVDADITVEQEWLKTIAEEIEGCDYLTYDVDVYTPDDEETLVARYNEHTSFPIEEYADKRDFGGGGCIAVRGEVFEDVGKFDHRLISGGDAEFGHRVSNSGREIRFTTETRVFHPARTSLKSQIKKEIRVGKGFCQLQRYYPERYGHPGIPPSPSGDGNTSEDSNLPKWERFAFWALGVLFLGCRGLGYVLELVAGESRTRKDDVNPGA